MITDYKTLLINLGTFLFSMTNVDVVLKVILLTVTIGYTLNKWWLLNKNNGKKKKQKKV
jgi:membrane-bound acyltransferase YfiQ involved in biofilm formation